MKIEATTSTPVTCRVCLLRQHAPPPQPRMQMRCVRCDAKLTHPHAQAWRNPLAASFALAALILYPAAVLLPVMRLTQMGHAHETGILRGVWALLADGHAVLALIVLICSVVVPLAKIAAIIALARGGQQFSARHRRIAHQLVELTGRWGMLDVLLVAVLVAAVKLGDLVDVAPGVGAVAFAGVVLLSMLATAAFDPRALWSEPAATSD